MALDGASASRVASRSVPDLILLDAVMPGLDGFETCRRLKAAPGLGDGPVISMTGLGETRHIVRGLEAGGVDDVRKPLVVEELVARIRVHLATARTARSARAALDASGRHLMAVDEAGRVLWSTPRARALVTGEGAARALPAGLFRPYRLTMRELQVLGWIAKGRSNRDAAEIMGLSTRTVDEHLEGIYAELGVENRIAAAGLVLTLLGRAAS